MKLPDQLASEPGLRTLQFSGRALFAFLVTLYFMQAGMRLIPVSGWLVWPGFVAYLVLQGMLLYRNSPGLALVLDLVAMGAVILVDPGQPAPSLVLLLVAVLSAGVIYGLPRFLRVLGGAALVLLMVVPLRLGHAEAVPAAGTLFLLATVLVCVLYFGLMLYRNQVLYQHARDATWRDPDTGLLSRAAMISTAGWLVPLHDRLSRNLSLVLMGTEKPSELKPLADQVATRLRRSDIAARYDDDSLALLLPDTSAADTESLLKDIRSRLPGTRAAMINFSDPEHSLEQVLEHLHRTLDRAGQDSGHWLAHASALHE